MVDIVYLIGKVGLVDSAEKDLDFGVITLVPLIVAVLTAAPRGAADDAGSSVLSAGLLWTQEMCFELYYFLRTQWNKVLATRGEQAIQKKAPEEIVASAATLLDRAAKVSTKSLFFYIKNMFVCFSLRSYD